MASPARGKAPAPAKFNKKLPDMNDVASQIKRATTGGGNQEKAAAALLHTQLSRRQGRLSVTCDRWRQHTALHQLGHLGTLGAKLGS